MDYPQFMMSFVAAYITVVLALRWRNNRAARLAAIKFREETVRRAHIARYGRCAAHTPSIWVTPSRSFVNRALLERYHRSAAGYRLACAYCMKNARPGVK